MKVFIQWNRHLINPAVLKSIESLKCFGLFDNTLTMHLLWLISVSFRRFCCALTIADNRLLDAAHELKSLNLKLSVENEQLRSGIAAPSNGTSAAAAAKISQLESKLLTQQEQLTDLHRRKGENAQMIIDLNLKLEKQNKLLGDRESR